MPRNYQDPIKSRTLEANTPAPVDYQVAANPVDTYVSPGRASNATKLADALSGINRHLDPYVQRRLQAEEESRYQQGIRDRTSGKEGEKDAGEAYADGFMSMDGMLKGNEDYTKLYQAYQEEFDKENGNLEEFVEKFHQGNVQGLDDAAFLKTYNNAMANGVAKLFNEHQVYKKDRAVEKLEATSMDMLTTMVKSYVDNGMPVDDGAVDSMRKFLNKDMGVSNSRFNDLLFGSIKRIGDEGNYLIYDSLKKKKPDGTPPMYDIPEWREKIDAAQLRATTVFLKKRKDADEAADEAREEAMDAALLDGFLDPDPKSGAAKIEHVIRTMSTKASEAITWRKHLEEYTDGKPSITQQDNEVQLLTGIIQRKTGVREVLNSDLTLTQRRYLLSEIEQAKRHDQAMAKDTAGSIFKAPEFKMGEDYITNMLRSQPNEFDMMGVGTTFEQQQRAAALLEYNRRAQQVKDPAELHAIREEIVTRYLKRRGEVNPGINGVDPFGGRIRYSTPQEVKANVRTMTNDELKIHIEHLKRQQQ